jgi:hypothetical protein
MKYILFATLSLAALGATAAVQSPSEVSDAFDSQGLERVTSKEGICAIDALLNGSRDVIGQVRTTIDFKGRVNFFGVLKPTHKKGAAGAAAKVMSTLSACGVVGLKLMSVEKDTVHGEVMHGMFEDQSI